MAKTRVFFRNDDVNRLEPGLVEVTDLLGSVGAVVSHAVEPANLQDDCRRFLLERAGQGVEIVQHGYAHTRHDVGEFGGSRSRAEQLQDLTAGLRIMRDKFDQAFFPAMSFPFGSYNRHTIPLLDQLGYPVVSCHWRHQASRQAFYRLGRILRRGRWLGRHVSHHMGTYPGTRVREISVTISPIRRYFSQRGPTACEFRTLAELQAQFRICRRISPVVGVVLHHRFRGTPESLADLRGFVSWLADQPEVEFSDFARIHGNPGGREGGVG